MMKPTQVKKVSSLKVSRTTLKNQTDIRKIRRYALTRRRYSLTRRNDTTTRKPSLGFGVFLIKTESGELEKKIIEGISYNECRERGEASEVFKWVPATPRTIEILSRSLHGCGQRCSRTCPEPGCLCHEGRCI